MNDTNDRIDELGRRAGAALRHPAPAGGLVRVRAQQRKARGVRLAGVGVVALAVLGLVVAVARRGGDSSPGSATVSPPRTTVPYVGDVAPPIRAHATDGTPSGRKVIIPDGFLAVEAIATKPLVQPELTWVRDEGGDLPTALNPCAQELPSDRDRIGGRQLALVSASYWKSGRLVVYRNEAAAKRALAELRDAVARCRTHLDATGHEFEWVTQPMSVSDESLYIGGQRLSGGVMVSGHYRGLLVRTGRAITTALDYTAETAPPLVSDVEDYVPSATETAARLASAPWAHDS
jgi:hypothetical protein